MRSHPQASRWRLPEPIELAVYYVVAEALTNTVKHAHATVIDVRTAGGGTALQVVLPLPTDWGHPPKAPAWREPSNPSSPARREEVDAADDEEELP